MFAMYVVFLLNFSRFLILVLSNLEAFSDLFESLFDVSVELAEPAVLLQGVLKIIAHCHVF